MPRKVECVRALLQKVTILRFRVLLRIRLRRRGGGHRLGDVDAGVLVPHEVDVRSGQVLADNLSPGAAGLVVPLADAVVEEGHARLVAEAVVADGPVRLAGSPVVVLRNEIACVERPVSAKAFLYRSRSLDSYIKHEIANF